jgi:hypothetical protein
MITSIELAERDVRVTPATHYHSLTKRILMSLKNSVNFLKKVIKKFQIGFGVCVNLADEVVVVVGDDQVDEVAPATAVEISAKVKRGAGVAPKAMAGEVMVLLIEVDMEVTEEAPIMEAMEEKMLHGNLQL